MSTKHKLHRRLSRNEFERLFGGNWKRLENGHRTNGHWTTYKEGQLCFLAMSGGGSRYAGQSWTDLAYTLGRVRN